MLRTRILTSAVGIPIVIGAIWVGTSAVGALIIVAAGIAGYEISKMSIPRIGNLNIFVMVIPLVMAIAGLLIGLDRFDWSLLAVVFIAGGMTALTFELMRIVHGRASYPAILGAGYIGAMLAHGAPLRSLDNSVDWILTAILITFATDTAAYFVGTIFGKRRLAPIISPSKTWEGALGGVAAGTAAAVGLTVILDLPIEAQEGAIIGVAASAAAVGGDLVESGFKRLSGVENSGSIIPGHGGVLDRIDSLAPNFAVVYWMAIWLTP
ncbi:MAG: phosphatidate cytidylyltransferase [Chloroflexi bacterium]|nr:phosphatidate cytidylyltransferase [Chloroflexota bacterium]